MPTFEDNDFQIVNQADITKRLFFNVSNLQTAHDVVLGVVGGLAVNQTLVTQDTSTGIVANGLSVDLQGGFILTDSGSGQSAQFNSSSLAGAAQVSLPPLANSVLIAHALGAQTDLTGQVANIGSTILLTAPVAGMYRITGYLEDTTPGTGTLAVTFGWTDNVGATTDAGLSLSLLGTGRVSRTIPIYVASGNVTFSTSGYLTGAYALHIRVEAL